MLRLVLANLFRRRLRSGLACAGIGVAVAVLLLIEQVGASYRAQLTQELNSMGLHLMLVPLGCPYDAAARVLKGSVLETSLPEAAVEFARKDPDVDIAAPLLIAALPREQEQRVDMFVGVDQDVRKLKRWWKARKGDDWFTDGDSVLLGAEAAEIEMREPGDYLFSPETGRKLKVVGILQRSGASDDNLMFVPLPTAQAMFNSRERITAVAIRLRDPSALLAATERLRLLPGAQVVTQTEMMGVFLNILGAVRTLLQSVAAVGLAASAAGLCNALLMSVSERRLEFSLYRAVGASRLQIFCLVAIESLLLAAVGCFFGLALSVVAAQLLPGLPSRFFPFAANVHAALSPATIALLVIGGAGIALAASIFPAWRAGRSDPASILKGAE